MAAFEPVNKVSLSLTRTSGPPVLALLAFVRVLAKARTGDSYLVPLPYPLGWFEV